MSDEPPCGATIIPALINDDLPWIIEQQQSGLTTQSRIRQFPYFKFLQERPKLSVIPKSSSTSLLLLSALHGAPRCFRFFFANCATGRCPPRLHRFAYQGGNFDIIAQVHLRYGPRPAKFHVAAITGHISLFVFLVSAYAPAYRFPPAENLPALPGQPCHLGRVISWLPAGTAAAAAADFYRTRRVAELQAYLTSKSVSDGDKLQAVRSIVVDAAQNPFHGEEWFCGFLVSLGVAFWDALAEDFCSNGRRRDDPRSLINIARAVPHVIAAVADHPLFPAILHFAVQKRRLGMIGVLAGVAELDPNHANSYGQTPITLAIAQGNEPMFQALLECPRVRLTGAPGVESPLLTMIRATGVHSLEFYRDPRINWREEVGGRLALAEMVFIENAWLYELLFIAKEWDFGVDINMIDSNKKTLLHYAVEKSSFSFVRRILVQPNFVPYIGDRKEMVAKFTPKKAEIKQMLLTAFQKAKERQMEEEDH
jgi:hypothetical protein